MQSAKGRPPRFLIFGANGQVGWELRRSLVSFGEVCALSSRDADLRDESSIREAVRSSRADAVINAAAYTAVDAAETDRDACMAINGRAPGIIADEAESRGAWVVHYSTDYVFSAATDVPRSEDDEPSPINFYGESKLAGDRAIIAAARRHLIFRTSWVYASRGKNFARTMLRLVRERDRITVVDDQTGAPTWARFIADATARALCTAMGGDGSHAGLYNLVCGGRTTWRGFAEAIARRAGTDCEVAPIATSDYPTAAARPAWSVLSTDKIERTFGIVPPLWDRCAELCMDELIDND